MRAIASYRRGLSPALALCCGICALSAAPAPGPRLTGIVRLDNRNRALLELQDEVIPGRMMDRFPILAEGERDIHFEVIVIDEKAAKVTMRHRTDPPFELRLEQTVEEQMANRSFNLHSAKLEQVLDIYQEATARTIIRPSNLVQERFDLKSGPGLNNGEASEFLARAFSDKGLLVSPDAEKFVFVISAGQKKMLSAISDLPKPEANMGKDTFAPGMMKFQDSDLLQVLDIYQDLTGRTVLRPQDLQSTRINVRSQTALTRNEVVWLLDALLSINGIAMAPENESFVFAVPNSRLQMLPQFDSKAAIAKTKTTFPPGPLKFQDVEAAQVLTVYAALLGRQADPRDKTVPHAKFSIRTQKALSQAEAIFALEAVARLNNLRFELVGEDQVQFVPSGARPGGLR